MAATDQLALFGLVDQYQLDFGGVYDQVHLSDLMGQGAW